MVWHRMAADSAWLRMDTPTNLMVVTSAQWFNRPLDRAKVTRVLKERMIDPFPRFSQRVVQNHGLWWEDVYLIDRYQGDGAAIFRMHHAIADGFSLVACCSRSPTIPVSSPSRSPRRATSTAAGGTWSVTPCVRRSRWPLTP